MGIFDNLENRLSSVVNGAFAKAFRSSVQPVEIASAIRTAMDDKAAIVGRGRTIVPNLFTIQLSPSDYDQLSDYSDSLTDELVAAAEEHADTQRYHPAGPLRVVLTQDDNLETGVFKLRPASAKDPWAQPVPPARSYAEPPTPVPAPASRPQPAPSSYAPGPAYAPGSLPEEPARGAAYGRVDEPVPGSASPLAHRERRPAPSRDDDELGATQAYQPVTPQRPGLDPTRRPWLDIDGDRYPLLGATTVVGRDGVADIVLDDPGISRRHAEVRIVTDGATLSASIRDLGSTNGTFVEGHRITSQRLADGDRVTIGRTSFTFRLGTP